MYTVTFSWSLMIVCSALCSYYFRYIDYVGHKIFDTIASTTTALVVL